MGARRIHQAASLRSRISKVYDVFPEVRHRYLEDRKKRKSIEVWKPDRHVRFMRKDSILRIHGTEPFRLRWTSNDWQSQQDTDSSVNALQIDFVDLPAAASLSANVWICFTFFWLKSNRWEGQDYKVTTQ